MEYFRKACRNACRARASFERTATSVLRSLAATAGAGPFMLVNDALDARREKRISTMALLSCGCTAIAWSLALGIVVLDIASWPLGLLGSGV